VKDWEILPVHFRLRLDLLSRSLKEFLFSNQLYLVNWSFWLGLSRYFHRTLPEVPKGKPRQVFVMHFD
jgi:hypothetical protein